MDDSIGIGDLAALITVAGATVYVLGLVGLTIPIRRMTRDISTAWYVTSLVPRIVVAGQGARIWLRIPLVMTVSTLLMLLAFLKLAPSAPLWLFSISSILLTSVLTLYFGRELVHFMHGIASVSRAYYFLGFVAIAITAGSTIMSYAVFKVAFDALFNVAFGFFAASRVTWILTFFAGSLVLGLPFAASASLPLPAVHIKKQAEGSTEGLVESLKGRLVAHNDGFWHLFDENDMLISIPDDKVISVQMPGREDTAPTVEEASANTVPEEDTKPGVEKS